MADLKRDKDFLRDLLLRIEGGETEFSNCSKRAGGDLERDDLEKLRRHLRMLEGAGFVQIRWFTDEFEVTDITFAGHEFLDGIRDPKVWAEIKTVANKTGAWSLEAMIGIARAYGKAKLAELGFHLP